MKRNFILGLFGLSALCLLSSCGDDEPTPAGVSFEKADQNITESDGTITSFHPDIIDNAQGQSFEVKLVFDKALPNQAVLKYKIDGTASSVNPVPASGPDNEVNDYEVTAGPNITLTSDEITVPKGAIEAVLKVTVFEDLDFEYNKNVLNSDKLSYETIIFTILSVSSGPAKLGTQLTHTMNITEDDAIFFLQWGTNKTNAPGDVDLDLLFTLDNQVLWGAYTDNNTEIINFPGGFPEAQYGMSYTYYSGSSDVVDFAVSIYTTAGTANGNKYLFPSANPPLVFRGSYTLKNINKWSDTSPPKIVQTMTKSGLNLGSITNITVPTDGSRLGDGNIKLTPEILDSFNSLETIQKFAKRYPSFKAFKAN